MNVADLLAGRLAELGVRRLWGLDLPEEACAGAGIAHMAEEDPALATLLADADGRVGEVDGRGRLGAALLAGPILHLSSKPGGRAPMQTVGSVDDLLDALSDPPGLVVPGTSALHLDLDLGGPVPDGADRGSTGRPGGPERVPVLTLDESLHSLRLLVVAGPGVVRAGALAGLRDASRAMGAGVLNTWGAKGVERWDSPFHFGTAGLQADDFALGGLPEADVVVATGLDPDEVHGPTLPHAVVQEVPPAQLSALCRGWGRAPGPPARRPRLYGALAEVVQPLYEVASAPLSPARAALHLSGSLPDGSMAVVDAGAAGLWVARTFPTSIPNSVCVPATAEPGFAVAAAIACRAEGRGVLAVTDDEAAEAPATLALLERAEAWGLPVAVQAWTDEPSASGGWESAQRHVDLCAGHLVAERSRIDRVPVDFSATADLLAVAGEVVAWPRR